MKYGSLILEKKEYVYLKRMLNISEYENKFDNKEALKKLKEELKEAHIVDDADMPKDVIRFNSKVTLFFENQLEKTFQVVAPLDNDVSNSKISVFAPMGAALLGYSEGDTVVWNFTQGKLDLKVIKVEQETMFKNIDVAI
ncbi:hypothetical protein GCM10022291_24700 [Postechiella marina]|uniref:Transcription elongation factor GreA/GreB C-terminal domain-containing protein n=1 Tax=Postechiella marina TaxID=943941 RepID=A0ABP8CCU8_9FLAO